MPRASRILDPKGLSVAEAQPEVEQVVAAGIDPKGKGQSGFIQSRRRDVYRLDMNRARDGSMD